MGVKGRGSPPLFCLSPLLFFPGCNFQPHRFSLLWFPELSIEISGIIQGNGLEWNQ